MNTAGSFVKELRRRRVFRLAGIYIVGAWGVLQVLDLAFGSWGLPETALRFVWIAALVLFPLALVFAWRYDITADGIVRTSAASGDEDLSLKPVDVGILVALLAVVVASAWLLVGQISDIGSQEPATAANSTEADPFSIAVLPFASYGSSEETTYFADGMHDDLLTTLSKVAALKVISPTSVLEYRDTIKNMRQIGRELGVANILEGRVQQAGNNVRFNVQLIDAETDEHLWAHIYDRELSMQNIFAIQSEITETIAAELAATLSPQERSRIRRDRTDNLDAFREFTYGKQQLALASFEALDNAVVHFRNATEFDPEYVLAHAALANAYGLMAITGSITTDEALARGRSHIDRATELDADNGYVQAVLASFAALSGDDDAAEATFRRAIGVSPNDVDVLSIYSTYLRRMRRSEEALVVINRALDLDPLSVNLYHDLGRVYLWLGRFEPALAAFRRISQINPGNPYAAHGAGMATILGGKVVEAGYWSDAAMAMDPLDYENPATAVFVYGSAGNLAMAELRMRDALQLGPDEPYPLARESYQEALTGYRKTVPELFQDPPAIRANDMQKAADLGHLLLAAGGDEQGRKLLEAVITAYDEEYTLGAANFPLGIANVEALAVLGRDDEAISMLRKLFDDGWRMRARLDTELNPNLDSLRDKPGYQAILADLEADLARQAREFKPPDQ